MFGEIASQESKPHVERDSSFRATLFVQLASGLPLLLHTERKWATQTTCVCLADSDPVGEGGVH